MRERGIFLGGRRGRIRDVGERGFVFWVWIREGGGGGGGAGDLECGGKSGVFLEEGKGRVGCVGE